MDLMEMSFATHDKGVFLSGKERATTKNRKVISGKAHQLKTSIQ